MSIQQQIVKAEPPRGGKLKLTDIRIDGGTQSRAAIEASVVDDYAEHLRCGGSLPEVVVFYDGEVYWLADGFHRYKAHEIEGISSIPADVRQGDRRDAILHSVGANAQHGLRRSNMDKRRAVLTLLNDAEWSKWSDREIARQCAVHHTFVGKIRPVTGDSTSEKRTYTTKHGTVATMQMARIGATQTQPIDGSTAPESASEVFAEALNLLRDTTLYNEGYLSRIKSLSPSEQVFAVKRDLAFERKKERERVAAGLPQSIRDREARKAQAIADKKAGRQVEASSDGLSPDQRIAELEEANRVLEAEAEELRAENKLYREMKVQFDQGGFQKVIADKDEEIRVLLTRVASESADKVRWAKSAKWWKNKALEAGYSRDEVIPFDEIEEGQA